MNLIKHIKSITLSVGVGISTSILLSSCDSNTPLEISSASANTATADSLLNLRNGDLMTFTSVSGEPSYSELEFSAFSGGAAALIGNGRAAFIYKKTEGNNFTLTLAGDFDPALRFPVIVANLLGSNSSLATEFREIIGNRLRPDFTDAEIARLKEILDPSGASLIGDSVNDLYSLSSSIYTNIVTSTHGDLLRGTMGGVYSLDADAKKIAFRPPTGAELGQYTYLNPRSQIPLVTNTVVNLDNIERGTWLLEVNNR